jgi:hypothetical protein
MSVTLPQPQQKELNIMILITAWVINNQSSSYFVENTDEKLLKHKLHEEPPT